MHEDTAGQPGEPQNEVQALAEAVLDAARVAGLGVTVSFDDGADLRHIYVNEAAAQILGSSVEQLMGGPTLIWFAPDERERVQSLLTRWRTGGLAPSLLETAVQRQEGERIPVEIAFSVVPLAGEPAVVMFLRDIRERKRNEIALRRSEQRFRKLSEAAPDAIGVSRYGRFVYVNPALPSLYGRPLQELLERDITEFVHADDRHLLACGREPPPDGAPTSGPLEHRIVHPSGRVVYVETLRIPIEYEGQPALLGVTRNTTERRLLQSHLALRDRMATLGMLAASVAHEINNPVAYTTLNLEAIARELQGCLPGEIWDRLAPGVAAARDGLGRVKAIVRDLQRLSLPNSTERWPVDVTEVLESALNVAMHAIGTRARIERDYTEVPPLKTDPTKLGQICLNLVLNAAESFETSDRAANVIRLRVRSSENEVLVSVSDNGPGIAREHLERIFDPFFTTKDRGMGLGLAICQSVVAGLGGKLRVESEVGEGSTFVLHLPVFPGPREVLPSTGGTK